MRNDPHAIFPAGVQEIGLYLPGTAGPTILESMGVLDMILRNVPENGRFLELGTWTGALAAWVAKHRPLTSVTSVDNFEFCPINLTLWQVNQRPNMNLFVGQTAQFFAINALKYNTFFIDADHTSPGVDNDLIGAAQFAADGATILCHDYGCSGWPDVSVAVDRFTQRTDLPVRWSIVDRLGTLVVLKAA